MTVPRSFIALLLSAILLAACGSSTPAPTQTPAGATAIPTAPPERTLSVTGTWLPDRDTPAVAVVGRVGYLAQGTRLAVLDLTTDPVNEAATLTLPARARQVAALGDTAVAVATENEVLIADFTSLDNPAIAATIPLASEQMVTGSVAVVVVSNGELILLSQLDLSELGRVALPGTVTALADMGRLIAVGLESGAVVLVDVSDPAQPTVQGQWDGPEAGEPVYGLAGGGSMLIAVHGPAGMTILDTSNPATPQQITQFADQTQSTFRRVALGNNVAYVGIEGAGHGVLAFSLSNPALPRVTGGYVPPAAVEALIAVEDGIVVLSDVALEKVWADFSTPEVANHYALAGGGSGDVAALGDLAYLALGPQGVGLLNLGNPAAPEAATEPLALDGTAGAVAIEGNMLYIVHTQGDGRLAISSTNTGVDGPVPVPMGMGVSEVTASASDLALDGGLALVAAGEAGLLVFDVSDPANPMFVGQAANAPAAAVVAANGLAYVSSPAPPSRLLVYDVSARTAPNLLGEVVLGGVPGGLAIAGERVLLNVSGGLAVVDVSVPAAPRVTAQLNVAAERAPGGLALLGERAYVGDPEGGQLRIYDVSDPALTRALNDQGIPVPADVLLVWGERLIASSSVGGLAVITP